MNPEASVDGGSADGENLWTLSTGLQISLRFRQVSAPLMHGYVKSTAFSPADLKLDHLVMPRRGNQGASNPITPV